MSGSATLGGQPLTKGLLGYVPQFDHLINAFTVRETLQYCFMLKCDRASAEGHGVVIDLAGLVGLAPLLDTRIGSLVSGQRKLVSVAEGLIAKPTVLFLDEPTTGLDSTAAHEVVRYVSKVAATGVTVIMTIHQPSAHAFSMVDHMLLLDKTGRVAFDGPVNDAVEYFAHQGYPTAPTDNAADVFLSAMDGAPKPVGATATSAPAASAAASRGAPASFSHTRGQGQGDGKDVLRGPTRAAQDTWAGLYQRSNAAVSSQVRRQSSLSAAFNLDDPGEPGGLGGTPVVGIAAAIKPVYDPPGELKRLGILIRRFAILYWRLPDFYLYRMVCITLFGLLAGTLYVNLQDSATPAQPKCTATHAQTHVRAGWLF